VLSQAGLPVFLKGSYFFRQLQGLLLFYRTEEGRNTLCSAHPRFSSCRNTAQSLPLAISVVPLATDDIQTSAFRKNRRLCLATDLSEGKGKGTAVFLRAMNTCEGAEVQFHSFLTWALHEVEWSASRCSRLKPHRSAALNNYVRGLVGTEKLDISKTTNVCCACRKLKIECLSSHVYLLF
jgi:hypothetical protein